MVLVEEDDCVLEGSPFAGANDVTDDITGMELTLESDNKQNINLKLLKSSLFNHSLKHVARKKEVHTIFVTTTNSTSANRNG